MRERVGFYGKNDYICEYEKISLPLCPSELLPDRIGTEKTGPGQGNQGQLRAGCPFLHQAHAEPGILHPHPPQLVPGFGQVLVQLENGGRHALLHRRPRHRFQDGDLRHGPPGPGTDGNHPRPLRRPAHPAAAETGGRQDLPVGPQVQAGKAGQHRLFHRQIRRIPLLLRHRLQEAHLGHRGAQRPVSGLGQREP